MAKKYQYNDVDVCKYIDQIRWEFQPFREERMKVIRALAGHRYSRHAAYKRVFLNLISLWFDIVGRNLFSQNPRVMLSTFEMSQKSTVSACETWMNNQLVKQDFADTMKRCVFDGLGGPMGIGYCALATPEESAMSGWGLQGGSPFITNIDLDDFGCDLRARKWNECDIIFHRVRVPFEVVLDDKKRFSADARKHLEPTVNSAYNKEGDERVWQISRGDVQYYDELEPKIDLWHVYFPRHRLIRIYAEQDIRGSYSAWEGGKPYCLEEKPWIGHEKGPYMFLGYDLVPGNLIPKGPALDLLDLHEMSNEGWRKLNRESAGFKKLSLCRRENPEDGKAVQTAPDMSMVPVGDPNSIKEMTIGGPDAGLFAFNRETIQQFMKMGGNLETLGGLASQAGTLGQEELLAQQSSGQIASKQDKTVTFVSDCCDRLLWYYWHDPRLVMESEVNDPNLPDVRAVRKVHPWNEPNEKAMRRVGNKPDIKIDPYTMRHTTPQQRAKDLLQIITSVWVPMSQIAMQQGKALDMDALFSILGKYFDQPDLQTIITNFNQQPGQGDSPASSAPTGPTKPPATERTYTRKDTGNNTAQNQKMQSDNALAAAMAGSANGNGNGQKGY